MRALAAASGGLTYYRWCNPLAADFGGQELRGPGAALDVGCGAGDLLSRLRELGWNASGIEPSHSAAAVAHQRGFSVQEASIEDAVVPLDAFDLVIFRHTLEHTRRPERVLAKCIRALRPGGIIAVAVPNFDSPGRRFFGAAWPPLEVPRHLYHFTEGSIRTLLRTQGAVVETVAFNNELGDVLTGIGNMVRLRSRDSARRTPGTGRVGTARGRPLNLYALSYWFTALYAPALRLVGLELRSSVLALGRRPAIERASLTDTESSLRNAVHSENSAPRAAPMGTVPPKVPSPRGEGETTA
ncbi:MAG TPA: class I SAM-dependent methyltransferase [Thermoplasmata archaeon]|nr:class I SAM-dependent methyltransferase [Thermoplasmata archaeon]